MWDPVCPATARYDTKRVVCIRQSGGAARRPLSGLLALRIGALGGTCPGPASRRRRPWSETASATCEQPPRRCWDGPGSDLPCCRAARPTAGRPVWDGRQDRHGEGCAGAAGKSAFTSAKVPTGPCGDYRRTYDQRRAAAGRHPDSTGRRRIRPSIDCRSRISNRSGNCPMVTAALRDWNSRSPFVTRHFPLSVRVSVWIL